MRVLLVKMSSLGDLIHTFPAISDLAKFAGKDLTLDWLVEEQYQHIPSWHRSVDNTVQVGLRRWRHSLNLQSVKQLVKHISNMRSKEYDIVIDAQGLIKSATLGCLLVRANSHGFDADSVREKVASFIYDHKHAVDRNMHAVERSRLLFAKALGYQVPTGDINYGVKKEMFGQKKKKSILFVPNCSSEEKLWQDDNWIEVGKLATDDGFSVEVSWGSNEEKLRAQKIAKACKASVVDPMDLDKVASLIASSTGMVSLDTGLSHIAAAFGVPNVCLCVTTDPKLSGAYGKNQVALGGSLELTPIKVWGTLNKMVSSK